MHTSLVLLGARIWILEPRSLTVVASRGRRTAPATREIGRAPAVTGLARFIGWALLLLAAVSPGGTISVGNSSGSMASTPNLYARCDGSIAGTDCDD